MNGIPGSKVIFTVGWLLSCVDFGGRKQPSHTVSSQDSVDDV